LRDHYYVLGNKPQLSSEIDRSSKHFQ
jgi:hypothetical protein